MLNVYYANAMVLAVPAIDVARPVLLCVSPGPFARAQFHSARPELLRHSLFAVVLVICLLPRSSLAISFTEVLSNPLILRSGTGTGFLRTF